MEHNMPKVSNELNEDLGQLPRLPACRFCHARKAKCDSARPKCALCVKHGEECTTLEVDGHVSFSRQYIGDLEHEIKTLEGELEGESFDSPDITSQYEGDDSNRRVYPNFSDKMLPVDRHLPNFVEGGGISFMRHLVADSGWREHDPSLLQNLTKASGPAEAGIKPTPLPSAEQARDAFDKYLSGSHVQNPFLLRREVERIYQSVFPLRQGESRKDTTREIIAHDLFRAFMILAIGSIIPYRNGIIEHHPYGYYLSAMNHLDEDILSRGLESIQDLLLVGRFAIYHHIGTSIWEIIRLCMRLCIEQGLHKPPISTATTSLLQEQLQRRVFWECYMIDRYSSVTLNRPCAIPERDIQVSFPANANDEEIEAAEISGSFPNLTSFCASLPLASETTPGNTEMSVFCTCLRLRQITSRIQSKFGIKEESSSGRSNLFATGVIYSQLDELLGDLQRWRFDTPIFETPRTLYETQEWYDLLHYRERLQLIRKAIDIVPKRNSIPPRDLLSLCLQSAVGAITAFWKLFEIKKITYTRSYFQMLFTAGFSVMYCLSVVKDINPESIKAGTDAVTTCGGILKQMSGNLPDAERYVAVYEALSGYIIRKYSRNLHGDTQTRPEGLASTSHLGSSFSAGTMRERYAPSRNHVFPTISTLIDHHEPTSAITPPASNNITLFDTRLTDMPLMSGATPPIDFDEPISEGSMLSWGIFTDDTLWSMEAGLNEYAYGDPPTLYWDNTFDLQNVG